MQRAFAEVKMLTGSAALEIRVPQLSRWDFGMQSQNLRLQWGSGTQLQPHGLPGLLKSHKNPFERAEEDLSTDPKERLLQGGGRFGAATSSGRERAEFLPLGTALSPQDGPGTAWLTDRLRRNYKLIKLSRSSKLFLFSLCFAGKVFLTTRGFHSK